MRLCGLPCRVTLIGSAACRVGLGRKEAEPDRVTATRPAAQCLRKARIPLPPLLREGRSVGIPDRPAGNARVGVKTRSHFWNLRRRRWGSRFSASRRPATSISGRPDCSSMSRPGERRSVRPSSECSATWGARLHGCLQALDRSDAWADQGRLSRLT
jgi:hypothetical protein